MQPNRSIAQQTNISASRKNIPLSVFAEVTRACNLNCYYCYQPSHKAGRELTLAQWKNVLAQLSRQGALYIAFSGGEPFIRSDFLEIVAAARTHNFAVSIISNGTCIGKKAAAVLAHLGVMDVGISLHASQPQLHDRLSGRQGGFSKALAAIRLLTAAGIKVLIKHCVSSENFGEYKKIEHIAQSEGCVFECDSTVLPLKNDDISPYALNIEQHRQFLCDMDMQPLASCIDTDSQWSLHCDAGRSMCAVDACGEIYPCILLPIPFGNAAERSFSEIWHSVEANSFRQQELSIDETCESCSMHSLCSRCHAVAWMESGDWRGKSKSLCDRAEAMRLNAIGN